MKKLRFRVPVMLLLLTACLLFASCGAGGAGKPLDMYSEDVVFDDTPTMKTAGKASIEGNFVCAAGDLAVVMDGAAPTTRYRIYNFVTDTVVLEWTDSETEYLTEDLIGLLVVDGETVFWLIKEADTDGTVTNTTVFYDDQGREICNFPKVTSPDTLADMLVVENRYYRMEEDGAFALKFEHSLLAAALPIFSRWSADYYYSIGEDAFKIYDQYGKITGAYTFPERTDHGFPVVLSSGNVLIQYLELLPDDAASYDLFDEGSKYNLVSLIYDVKKASTKEVTMDFIVVSNNARGLESAAMKAEDYDMLHKSIDNLASIIPIEDKAYTEFATASISDNGSLKEILNNTIPDQGLSAAVPVMADRYLVADRSVNSYLVNGKGELIGDVTNADTENSNNVFVLGSGRVYDSDLKFVFDYTAEEYELFASLDNLLLFSKEARQENGRTVTEYYRMTAGMTQPEKLQYDVVTVGDGYYVLRENDTSFIYYNDCGEELFRSETQLTYRGTSVDASVMLFETDKIFYCFRAAAETEA